MELNVRRIPCIAAIIIIFQVANLIVVHAASQTLPVWGVILFITFAAVYGFSALCIPFRIMARPRAAKFFYLSFWVLLYVGYIPFFIQDMTANEQFTNVILFFSGLIIVPVFTRTERAVLTPLFTAATLLLAFLYHTSVSYIVFLVVLGISVGLLSYAIQDRSLSFLRNLLYEAYCDVLTGVLNRRGGLNHVKKTLDAAKEQANTLVFFMVDIDFFKNVNDAYGHRKGDEVLVVVADTLKIIFNKPEDIICRIGGEEFLVCVAVKDQGEAEAFAAELLHRIEDRHIETPRQDASQYLTVSVGVRIYTPENENDTIDELTLIDDADTALYRAKDGGRNQYVVY